MRILEVIGSVDPRDGGAIEGMVRQSNERTRRGMETHLVSLDSPDAPWVRDCPVKTFAMGTRQPNFHGRPWDRYGYTPRLVPWLRDNAESYDIVVVNGLWNYSTLAARRVLPTCAVPYVVFVHGQLDPYFRAADPKKHAVKQLMWFASEGPLLSHAHAVFFTAEDEMARASRSFWPYRVRGRMVGYGTADIAGDPVGQKRSFRAAVPALGDRPFLLFLSRLHPKKACDILIDAFIRVASANPELQLVMAGPDPSNWRGTLEPVARAAGIAERIHWPGMLSGDVKWGALRGCEAMVLPSHHENFGVVVAETMAAGRPVLISNQVNIWREVEADGGGLVSGNDVESFSRILRDFLALSPEARDRMGEAARACFLARFEVGIAVDKICAALDEIRRSGPAARERAVAGQSGPVPQAAPIER
jgi:glycosyltransferase involved in cell wall biosynthesis